jgi:hypothetical protein
MSITVASKNGRKLGHLPLSYGNNISSGSRLGTKGMAGLYVPFLEDRMDKKITKTRKTHGCDSIRRISVWKNDYLLVSRRVECALRFV